MAVRSLWHGASRSTSRNWPTRCAHRTPVGGRGAATASGAGARGRRAGEGGSQAREGAAQGPAGTREAARAAQAPDQAEVGAGVTQENMVRRLLARMTGREQTARLDALERTIRKLADAQREHAAVQQAALAALTARQQQQSTTREVKEAVDAVRALGHVVDRTI